MLAFFKGKFKEYLKPHFLYSIGFPVLLLIAVSVISVKLNSRDLSSVAAVSAAAEVSSEQAAGAADTSAPAPQPENPAVSAQGDTAPSQNPAPAEADPKSVTVMQTTPAAAANPAVPVSNGVKTAYLTFDDGPSVNTPAILDILRRYEVKATFFVMGSDYIGYLKDIANDGHAIGLHTYTHNYGLVYRSTDAFFNEINTIAQVVKDVTGTQTNLLRFPGGSSNKISRQYCAKIMTHLITAVGERGYRYFDWNCDIGDAAGINIPAERLIYNIQVSKKHESLCVLMHDKDTKATTAEALPAVIEYLRGEGYSFAALGEGSPDFHHTIINN